MTRYEKLVDDVNSLGKMLQDMRIPHEDFMSYSDREQVISSLVSTEIEDIDRTILREMLRYGCTGYDEMSDIELVEKELTYTVCDDEETFDIFETLPTIEAAVRSKIDELMTKQAEKIILSNEDSA